MGAGKAKDDIAHAVSSRRAPRRKAGPGRPPAASGPGLTRECVVAAAASLARREGFEAVSTRRLATELGVWAGAVSYHAPSKDELLDDVADLLLSQCPVTFQDKQNWRERLRIVLRALAQIASDYPGFADWVVRRVDLSASRVNGAAVGRVFMEIFVFAGLSKIKARNATVAAHAMALGVIKLIDAARARGGKVKGEERWPVAGDADREATRFSPDRILEVCYDHLVAALEAELSRSAKRTRPPSR